MEYVLADTVEKAQYVLKRAYGETSPCGYDTETEAVDVTTTTPVSVGNIVCFSIAGEGWKACVDGDFLGMFRTWLEDDSQKKYVANAKFEMHIAANHHIKLRGIHLDTVLASFTLYPHLYTHSVEKAGVREFGESKKPFRQVCPDSDTRRAWLFEREEFALYSADDAMWERRLGMRLKERLEKAEWRANLPLLDYYNKYQAPFTHVLFEMERNGVLLDREYIDKTKVRALRLKQDTAVEVVRALGWAPRSIDKFVNSTQELIREFYDKRKLPIMRTKGLCCSSCGRTVDKRMTSCPKHPGAGVSPTPSTDSDALAVLFNVHKDPLTRAIIKYRKIAKKIEELDKLVYAINPVTGRAHPGYSQNTARTGRLSSSNFNAQNISSSEKEAEVAKLYGYEAFDVRQAFYADAENGYIFTDHDESQLEYRILAHYCQEPVLLEGFRGGLADFHSLTAKAMFGDNFTPAERKYAKNLNFSLNYGAGKKKAAWTVGCTEERAAELIALRQRSMPRLYAWWADMKEQAHQRGYSANLLGWRRPLPELHMRGDDDETRMKRAKAERIAINFPIQSTAAEIVKIAQMKLLGAPGWESEMSEKFRATGAKMLIQVHDEILSEVPQDNARAAYDLTVEAMQRPFPREMSVPLVADGSMGTNWGEC